MKEESEGPALRRSWKEVRGRGEGFSVTEESEVAVA
jgi:hypothetical protein